MPEERKLSEDTKAPESLNYQEEVHTPTLEEIFEEVAQGKVDSEEAPVDKVEAEAKPETPSETPPEEVKVEAKPEESVTPPIDPEKLKEEISEATAKKLLEQLAPADATKEEKKDLLADAPWTKENREPTWEEALSYMAQKNKESVKQELLEELHQEVVQEEERARKAEEEAETQRKQREDAWNTEWNNQLSDLERLGKIAKVLNPNDPNDPGRRARLTLFETMKRVADERTTQNLPPILNLKEIFYEHYQPDQPGKDAPVAGAKKSVTTNDSDYSYQDIHNTSLEALLGR